ncbi:hypothetical protein JW613_13230 [Streptomyces smyrnaeus]|uniref:Uncharacterized protein n=1 Tax=Streptomyces smyrnaeus TaxID=1387713 RepID=A0ABS3XVB3_9ACTN|nr:hypothetical protein [Streptomyces smyrnaeus]MBO8199253.1 hypothetical protein [Streptomyces smyrnaeus]
MSTSFDFSFARTFVPLNRARRRAVALHDRDRPVAVDHQRQIDSRIVPVLGKRPQQEPFLLEIEADRGRTAVDVLGILGRVDRSQTLVQLDE